MAANSIYRLFLNRKNYTWDVDEATAENIKAALEEAEALLRSLLGKPDIDLSMPEYRGLWIDYAWYIINDRRAEFEADYLGQFTPQRILEG